MGHHHPHVNHSLWQPPHAQGLALIGVVKARIEIAATLLCEKCKGLLVNVARSVVTIGRKLRPNLQGQQSIERSDVVSGLRLLAACLALNARAVWVRRMS